MGEGHAGMGLREVTDLLPPRHLVAAQAMREDDRGTAAGHLVVKLTVGPRKSAHMARW